MRKMTIGTGRFAEELSACLAETRERLLAEGIALTGERFARGGYTFLTYRVSDPAAAGERTLQAVAEGVATFITDVWERREMQRIVANDFYYYEADEIDYLVDSAAKMLQELTDEDGQPLRFRHIALQVAEQLASGADLVIEGLLRFRMPMLEDDLHRVIEQAIDEYLLDLEQQEFVKLLRYFLEAQEPQLPLLHLVCTDGLTTLLYDAEGRPLAAEELQGLTQHMSDSGVLAEDLMSVLIALAPERLVAHLRDEQEPPFWDTVTKIFGERAQPCTGCQVCLLPEQAEWSPMPINEQNGK